MMYCSLVVSEVPGAVHYYFESFLLSFRDFFFVNSFVPFNRQNVSRHVFLFFRKQKKKERLASLNCNFEGLNCFVHDNEHWKTPPLWTRGPVCICLGSSNGTFDCLRGVGGGRDDNWLYCRFVTGFLSYYDLTVDPYQLHNLAATMDAGRLQRLDARLARMQTCRGADQCRPLPGAEALTATTTEPPPPSAPPPPPPTAEALRHKRRPGADRTGYRRHVRRRRQRARSAANRRERDAGSAGPLGQTALPGTVQRGQ